MQEADSREPACAEAIGEDGITERIKSEPILRANKSALKSSPSSTAQACRQGHAEIQIEDNIQRATSRGIEACPSEGPRPYATGSRWLSDMDPCLGRSQKNSFETASEQYSSTVASLTDPKIIMGPILCNGLLSHECVEETRFSMNFLGHSMHHLSVFCSHLFFRKAPES